jgi:hypothetical protein
LGASVPSDLVITNLQIKREQDLWQLKLAGAPQAVKLPKSLPMSNAVALLKTRLAGAPFHLQILDDEEKQKADLVKPGGAGSSLPGWLSRVSTARTERPAPAKPEAEDHFVIEGEIR